MTKPQIIAIALALVGFFFFTNDASLLGAPMIAAGIYMLISKDYSLTKPRQMAADWIKPKTP